MDVMMEVSLDRCSDKGCGWVDVEMGVGWMGVRMGAGLDEC